MKSHMAWYETAFQESASPTNAYYSLKALYKSLIRLQRDSIIPFPQVITQL